jgi:hypothetical protein
MKIKSAKSFRTWYKNLIPARKQADFLWDENFIGVQHKDLSGFFTMYHGDKEQVYDFLRKEVEMAEDGQAIYEFVQNAADSNSTKFYMFYDENYLIVINNGDVFSKEGIKSILNIGQSYGKENTDKIGRYGIGFKLVHRLVGKSSGLDELLNVDNQGYRGPILFSWSEKSQFNDFLNSNEFEYVDFSDKSAPWLLKILITNFPVESKEKVKDIDFNEIEPFQLEELKSFQIFLNSCIDKIDLNSLNSGSIFFLKLGDKKFDYLEKQQNEYLNGLSTSMHFLKSLETLTINETVIKRDEDATNVLEFTVKNGSDDFNQIGLSEIRDKESDAKFKICFADNVNSANEIKKHPNIYKYFPAVKEVNNLSFVIHSNLFELSSNRQNLTETPINKKLLGLLSNQIINLLENFKIVDRNKFKSLFTSILMSDESSNESSGNGWQSEYFYNKLLEYIREVIPTKGNEFADNTQNVKINKLKRIELNLSDFGLFQIKWFEWDKSADKLLIEAAKKEEKLRIEEWDIRDVIENADLDSINKWIANCDKKLYEGFLKELENSALRTKTKERICQIKLFKFSNHKFYSFNDLIVKRLYAHNTISKINSVFKYNFSNVFFKTDKNEEIAKELNKLGIILSTLNISKYPSIFSSIEKIPDENDIYLHIAEKCKTNNLNPSEKKKIFLNFINDETKLNNVVKETLNELQLFSDNKSDIIPLNKLIGNIKTPSWLNIYKIKQEEYFSELDTFLLTESKDLFNNVYLQNKEDIISNVTTTAEITSLIELYQVNQKSFFKEFIIKKVKNEFIIIEKTNGNYQVFSADKEARKFIDENCKENLFVLPNEFKEKCRNEEGIIKAEDLHNLILDYIIADDHKELLCDFIGNKAKHKFLLELSEFRFSEERKYTKDDYEYKILEIACSELNEIDYKNFQKKVIIEAKNGFLKLSQIPPITDKIKIDNYDLSLSKILPKNYENSDLLGNLIFQFIDLGLNKDRIKSLFGVSEETEPSEIFQMFSEQIQTLANPDQFFFLIYYNQHIEKVDLSKLGFDLNCAVYPSEFALEKERLPEYLQNWITNNEINLSELEEIGVFTINSTLVSLRKFFLTKSEFNNNAIAEKLSSKGTMLLNTFELMKEKVIEISNDNEFSVFEEIVRVINTSRAKGQELKIQDEYNFAILEEKSTKWQTVDNFEVFIYKGALPKIVKLDEIQDYVFYHYNDSDFAVNGNSIFINENVDSKKTLQKVASDDSNKFSFEELWSLFEDNKKDTQQEKKEPNSNFLDDVNEFISELEGTEWNDFVSELKNILELSLSHQKEKQKLFNLIAKIKLAKELDLHFEVANKDYNHLESGKEKYFVHSARGAFAYIHPNEILKMKDEGYKMALDFSTKSRVKIYETAEEILQLNTNHILAYQKEKSMEDLVNFCQANRDANKHLLIIDKNNSGEKSRALLKLLNIEDEYQ